jgi:hypothetical protein
MKRVHFWKKCISIMMVMLLVLTTYSPMIQAEEVSTSTTDSPLQLTSTEGETLDNPQTNPPEQPTEPPTEQPTEPATEPTPETTQIDTSATAMIQAQATQTTGRVVNGTTPVADTVFSIHTVAQEPTWYDFQTDANGYFSYNLPDGEYQVDGIWKDPTWYALNQIFTIQDGEITGATELVIDVQKALAPNPPNLNGVLVNGTVPLASIPFSIHTLDGSTWYDTTTNGKGEFEFSLPDGSYQLDGIWLDAEGKWYELNQVFKMVNGQLEGATPLIVNLAPANQDDNVTGTLKKGDEPLANTIFSIRSTNGDEKWYDIQTNQNGAFHAKIPDGTYRLEGVWLDSEEKWYELQMNITVSGQLDWTIDLLERFYGNVSGLLRKGPEPLLNTIFSVRNTTDGSWYDGESNGFGYYDIHLPDGEFIIEGVWVESENKWYELNKVFTVQNHLQMDIDVLTHTNPLPNVSGSLKKGTTPLANVTFSLHTTTPNPIWYDTTTNESGNFKLTLPDGFYQIDGIWDPVESKWYELNQQFTVADGKLASANTLLINVAGVTYNVTGTVRDANGIIAQAEVSILQKSIGYVQFVHTDATGTFSIQLEDDEYEIEGIHSDQREVYTPVGKLFTVLEGEMFVDGVATSSLAITLPAITVTAVLYDAAGQALQEQTVKVKDQAGNYYSSLTNEEGIAQFRLADGDYIVEHITSQKLQYPFMQPFSVINGEIFIKDEKKEKLELKLHANTLKGQILDGEKILANTEILLNKGSVPNNDPIGLYKTVSDENGNFELGLPDGEYNVLSVKQGNEIPVNMVFEISGGKLLVNGVAQEFLQVKLQPITLKGVISFEGLDPARIYIQVLNTDSKQFYNTITDANGHFELRLPDGNYKTITINRTGIKNSILHNQTFVMLDGKLMVGDQAEETLLVNIGKLTTVKGQIAKSAGDPSVINGFHISLVDHHYATFQSVQEDGTFELILPDGSYQLETITVDQMSVSIKQLFNVVGGKLFVGGVEQPELLIKLLPVSLKGKVVLPNDEASQDVYVQVTEQTKGTNYTGWTVNGSFAFRLPDGQYKVGNVYLEKTKQWVETNITFSIVGGKLLVNNVEQSEISINVLAITLKGNLTFGYETGNKVVNLQVRDAGGKIYSQWTDSEGNFSFRLPDGQYRIQHAYPDELKKWVLVEPITFSIVGGKLTVSGASQDSLTIGMPKIHAVTGRLMENDVPLKNATVGIGMQTAGTGALKFTTDDQGYFTAWLQDGKFAVQTATVNYQSFSINKDFDVVNGKVIVDGVEQELFVVKLPPVNFQVTIVNEFGVAQKSAILTVFGDHWSNFHHPMTNTNGQASLRLGDGNYEIGSIKLTEYTDSIPYSLKFSVVDGKLYVDGVLKTSLVITIPKLHTIPFHMEKDGQPITEGAVFIGMQDGNLFSAKRFTDANGDFKLTLQDGKFKIISIEHYGQHVGIAPILFEIIDGKIYIDGVLVERLVIK